MKKILSSLRRKLFASALVALGMAGVARAEGTGTDPISAIGQAVVTELESWTSGITSFFTTNIGSIMTVLGVAIAISLVWMVFKIFRKGSNKVGG